MTALLGRNGVGKTTTLKAIIGLAPRTGRILLQDKEIQDESTTRIIRGGIGYVPEDREVFGGLTVDENLRLVDPDRGVEAPIVGTLFPTSSRAKQRAGTLSGGQQQMVSLARVLLRDMSVLLIDEPTKGLAPKLVTEVADVLAEVADHPILLVEQNLPLVRRIADTVVVLDAARSCTGVVAELVADPQPTRELLGVSMRREGAA